MNISQFIKCGGASLGGMLPTAAAAIYTSKETTFSAKVGDTYKSTIVGSLLGSTAPAAVANVIDTYVNSYVSSNEYVQYGLTALEGSVLSFVTYQDKEKSFSQNITETFSELIELSITYHSLLAKAVVLGAAAEAVAFKYILSDSEETSFELGLDDSALEVA
jgi:hypothetical protein